MAISSAAKALLLKDGKILLNRCRRDDGSVYYDLPGGGQHQGEKLEDAVLREIRDKSTLARGDLKGRFTPGFPIRQFSSSDNIQKRRYTESRIHVSTLIDRSDRSCTARRMPPQINGCHEVNNSPKTCTSRPDFHETPEIPATKYI